MKPTRATRIGGWAAALSAALLAWLAGPAAAQGGLHQFEEEFVRIIEQVRPSVVQVTGRLDGQELSWSGVVLDSQGHIASAGRVLGLADQLTVQALGKKRVAARRLGFDPVTTVGVLKVEPSSDLVPVVMGDPEKARLGSLVVVVGNPFGLAGSVSTGILSGRGRTIQAGGALLPDMLQTTAPINPGDSGGLLADSRGRMIGIITSTFGRSLSIDSLSHAMRRLMTDREFGRRMAAFAEVMKKSRDIKDPQQLMKFLMEKMQELEKSGPGELPPGGPHAPPHTQGHGLSAQGINFVLPADHLTWVTGQIVRTGEVRRGWLGLKVRADRKTGRENGPTGVPEDGERLQVETVVPEGPAARAGLQVGDELVKVAGREMAGLLELRHWMLRTSPGDEVSVVVRRGGKEHAFKLLLGKSP